MSTRKKAGKLAAPGGRSTDQAVTVYEPTLEEIQARAYEIYVQRGYVHGSDLEDWFQAENELKRNSNKRTSV
jgi:Protein of unknown function (DUF2934)